MRALITTCFLLLLVVSAPLLIAGVNLFPASPAAGIFVVFIWTVVMSPFIGAFYVVWIRDERPRFSPSDIFFEKRNYVSWNSINGWPRAQNLRYECGLCHKTLPSQTNMPLECGCGNLYITPDAIGAQTPMQVLVYEE